MTETRQRLPLERFLFHCELNGLCQHRRRRRRKWEGERDKLNFQLFYRKKKKQKKCESTFFEVRFEFQKILFVSVLCLFKPASTPGFSDKAYLMYLKSFTDCPKSGRLLLMKNVWLHESNSETLGCCEAAVLMTSFHTHFFTWMGFLCSWFFGSAL